jgi:glucose/arabinose dehydrogenase
MYVSVGSSCNACLETDERRAAIMKCALDGTNCRLYAKGLRNAVGFVFHQNQMYATDNGRDLLGNDIPPEEVNVVQEGRDYGWPLCFGSRIHDANFDRKLYARNPCENTAPPLVQMQAHSAPLGLSFYTGGGFPEEYRGDLFVAFHGSWNRDEPTGYKIARIDFPSLAVSDFASGWLQLALVAGRPVDIIEVNGSLYVSDDSAGKIYRIWYSG